MEPVEAPTEASLHGVLVDVSGIGVLLLGESGTGKSECALDLVTRGHRLVADDVVEIWREGPQGVIGRGPARIRHHMEIRGLGIINIRDLFGVAAVRDRKRIELVIQLEAWRPDEEYERLGRGGAIRTPCSASRFRCSESRCRSVETWPFWWRWRRAITCLKRMGVHAARAFTRELWGPVRLRGFSGRSPRADEPA